MGLPVVPTSLGFYSKVAADNNCPLPIQIKMPVLLTMHDRHTTKIIWLRYYFCMVLLLYHPLFQVP